MTEPQPTSLDQIVDDQIVRGFKHVEWLSQLALVLEIANNKRGPRASPFQHGAVNRIRMAVRYVELLEREARDNARMTVVLEAAAHAMLAALEEANEQLVYWSGGAASAEPLHKTIEAAIAQAGLAGIKTREEGQ